MELGDGYLFYFIVNTLNHKLPLDLYIESTLQILKNFNIFTMTLLLLIINKDLKQKIVI